MTQLNKWEILDSQYPIYNPWCKVRQDRVRLPSGQIINDYFVHERPEIVLILPITPQKEIIFVRQYRHGIQDILLELPAGTFDSRQEDRMDAARRELEEETGYVARSLTFLSTIYDNPVKDNNQIHLFIAQEVLPIGHQSFDLTEEIEVIVIPIVQVYDKIANGEICVAGTLAAILLGLGFPSHKMLIP